LPTRLVDAVMRAATGLTKKNLLPATTSPALSR
jgi:hypothetical protein